MGEAQGQQRNLQIVPAIALALLLVAGPAGAAEPPAGAGSAGQPASPPAATGPAATGPPPAATGPEETVGVDDSIDWSGLYAPGQLEADNAYLPMDVDPAEIFALDSDHQEVFFGWRIQF